MSETRYDPDHVWTTVRTARKAHSCEWCRQTIAPGSVYVEYRCSPAHEWGGGVWSRLRRHQFADGECVR